LKIAFFHISFLHNKLTTPAVKTAAKTYRCFHNLAYQVMVYIDCAQKSSLFTHSLRDGQADRRKSDLNSAAYYAKLIHSF